MPASKPQELSLTRMVVGCACILVGLFAVWIVRHNHALGSRSATWPSVPGRVTLVSADEQRRFCTINYEYAVNETKYSTYAIGPRGDSVPVGTYNRGDHVTVYYDPQRPSQALLQPGAYPLNPLEFLGAAIFFSAGGLCFFAKKYWGSSRGPSGIDATFDN